MSKPQGIPSIGEAISEHGQVVVDDDHSTVESIKDKLEENRKLAKENIEQNVSKTAKHVEKEVDGIANGKADEKRTEPELRTPSKSPQPTQPNGTPKSPDEQVSKFCIELARLGS